MGFLAPAFGALAGTGIPTALGTAAVSYGLGELTKPDEQKPIYENPEELQKIIDANLSYQRQSTEQALELGKLYGDDMVAEQLRSLTGLQRGTQGQPGTIALSNEAKFGALEGDIDRMGQMSPQVLDQIKASNPELYAALDLQDRHTGLSKELGQHAVGSLAIVPQLDTGYALMNAPLHDIYQKRAAAVQRDGRLSEEQQRDVQQATRAADQTRGVLRSGMSIGNEILNTQRARQAQQRFDEGSLAMAGQMINQNVAGNMAGRSSLIRDAAGIDAQLFGQNQSRIANRVQTQFDPTMFVTGRPAGVQQSLPFLQQAQQPNALGGFNATATSFANNFMDTQANNATQQSAHNMGIAGLANSYLTSSGTYNDIFNSIGKWNPFGIGVQGQI